MIRVLVIFLCLIPSLSFAAYQNPTVVSNQRQPNGSVLITFSFAGNAGEPTIQRGFVVQPQTTATTLRNWIADTIDELDLVQTAATLPLLQKDQVVPKLARTPATPSACQVWTDKFFRYVHAKDSGVTAIATDLAALKANLESTYPAGCLQ